MTEDQIEQFAIARLSELGYAYQHGPGIAHDGEHPERASYEQVLLLGRLRAGRAAHQSQACPAAAQERR
jgi:type I restriction enzyme R subunit